MDDLYPPDPALRARWIGKYKRIIESCDMVRLGQIADWLSRESGRVDRSEKRRRQALADLSEAISFGEFGPREKPQLAFMPKEPTVRKQDGTPIPFWVRPTASQLECVPAIEHLFASRALLRRWFEVRTLSPPPWLGSDHLITTVSAVFAPRDSGNGRMPPPKRKQHKREGYRRWLIEFVKKLPKLSDLDVAIEIEEACERLERAGKPQPDLPKQRRSVIAAIKKVRGEMQAGTRTAT